MILVMLKCCLEMQLLMCVTVMNTVMCLKFSYLQITVEIIPTSLSNSIIKLVFVLQWELISDYLVFSAYWSNRPCAITQVQTFELLEFWGKFISGNLKYPRYIVKLLLPSQ
uniref:Uncharacterized protein n=1 Tax=Cacopsylla melanoneura TaxID=428564 RepID=A0A8D8T768_9HEMI